MPEYKYQALDYLHERPTYEELCEWHKSKVECVTGQGLLRTLGNEAPINSRKDQKRIQREIKKEQMLTANSIAMDYIDSAEKGKDGTSGYQLMESCLFALTTAIKILDNHPNLWDKYSPLFYGGNLLPPARANVEMLRYLGRCLEKIVEGEDADQALNINGGKGKFRPTPKGLDKKDKENYLRSSVALMVYVYKQHENKTLSMEDIFLEVASLFNMEERANTVKDWYRKYLDKDQVFLDYMSEILKQPTMRKGYVLIALAKH